MEALRKSNILYLKGNQGEDYSKDVCISLILQLFKSIGSLEPQWEESRSMLSVFEKENMNKHF